MEESRSRQAEHDWSRIHADVASLYRECVEALRGNASPDVWQRLEVRIAELNRRVDLQAARGAAGTFRGRPRARPMLHVLDQAPPSR